MPFVNTTFSTACFSDLLNGTPLDHYRSHKVVSHPECCGRAVFNHGIENTENCLSTTKVVLQFQRLRVDMPLEENHYHKDCIRIGEHRFRVSSLQRIGQTHESIGQRLLPNVIKKTSIAIEHDPRTW